VTDFYKTDTYKIVKAMKATGNQTGIIAQWKARVEAWAFATSGLDVEAVKPWLALWQARPFYTAAELEPIWRVLPIALGFSMRAAPFKSANRLANELKFAGLPHREIAGKTYFIVERVHYWRDAPQEECDAIFNG